MDNLVSKTRLLKILLKIFMLKNIFVGILDPQKLIQLKINHMNQVLSHENFPNYSGLLTLSLSALHTSSIHSLHSR